MKSISEALVYTLLLPVSYSHVDPRRTRAISHASFLEGIAVRQSAHVSADVSVHYIGQRRAYQAKTCSLSGPSPSRPCPVPSVHYAIVIHLVGSAS